MEGDVTRLASEQRLFVDYFALCIRHHDLLVRRGISILRKIPRDRPRFFPRSLVGRKILSVEVFGAGAVQGEIITGHVVSLTSGSQGAFLVP